MEAVLGLDTSCYTTSLAAVGLEGTLLASCRKLLEVPSKSRGLQQSQAVFFHVRALPELMRALRAEASALDIRAVCASTLPRDADESYMPVFGVGESQGRSLAALLDVPFYATDHQSGHLRAALIGTGLTARDDCLALHLSGGTTELLEKRGASGRRIGEGGDISAGQLVDRTGVALGGPFPSGPWLERLARLGQARQRLGVSMSVGTRNEATGDPGRVLCHFSGAEAQVARWIASGALCPEDIAAEIYALLARSVARLIEWGRQRTGLDAVLLAGGVASSQLFRELLTERLSKRGSGIMPHFSRPELAGDNAVGVAMIGLERLKHKEGESLCLRH